MLGDLPLNADWIDVQPVNPANTHNTYSEAIQNLMEAWSVHHKTDGNPSLLNIENYAPGRWNNADGIGAFCREYNAVFGQELESFSQKRGIIQSGLNTMQTTFVLELEFAQTNLATPVPGNNPANADTSQPRLYNTAHTYELRTYIMYDKVIAFDETSGSIRSEY